MITRASGESVLWVLLLTFLKDQHNTLPAPPPLISDLITMNFHNDVTIRLSDTFNPFRAPGSVWSCGFEKNPAPISSHNLSLFHCRLYLSFQDCSDTCKDLGAKLACKDEAGGGRYHVFSSFSVVHC